MSTIVRFSPECHPERRLRSSRVEVLQSVAKAKRRKTASATYGSAERDLRRFLTRRLQKLHFIVSGKKVINRPSVGCDIMPHAATAPSYINKISQNGISSLRLPGVSRTSPPTDGQIASLLAFSSKIVQRLSRLVRNLRRSRCALQSRLRFWIGSCAVRTPSPKLRLRKNPNQDPSRRPRLSFSSAAKNLGGGLLEDDRLGFLLRSG